MKSPPPKPPPMRCLQGYTWINEWELVDWYTEVGLPYPKPQEKSNWFLDLFKRDYQIRLDMSLRYNEQIWQKLIKVI